MKPSSEGRGIADTVKAEPGAPARRASEGLRSELDDRRETYQGFSESMAKGFEFAVIPVIFGAVGYGLDHWLGTTPLFIIVLVVVALVGLFARMWYGYDHAMKGHEAEGPWRAGRSR